MKKVYTTKEHVIYKLTKKERKIYCWIKYIYIIFNKTDITNDKEIPYDKVDNEEYISKSLDDCFDYTNPCNFSKAIPSFINLLINKYNKSIKYEDVELYNFYTKVNNKYICCFNINGKCIIKKCYKIESVIKFFDKKLTNEERKKIKNYVLNK